MTIQQLAKHLNIPAKLLEKQSLRAFLLTKLGEIEAKRQGILKKYSVESTTDWDEKAKKGQRKEGGYQGTADYFLLDALESEKADLVRELWHFHKRTEANVVSSPFSVNNKAALLEFLEFAKKEFISGKN